MWNKISKEIDTKKIGTEAMKQKKQKNKMER